MLRCLSTFAFLAMSGCAPVSDSREQQQSVIEYSTADGSFSYVFTPKSFYAGFGPQIIDKAGVRGAPIRQIQEGNMHCILAGEKGDEVSFAIERPTKLSSKFECGNNKFEVVYCNGGSMSCENALVRSRYYSPMKSGKPGGPYIETMYFYDQCRGILSFMDKGANEVEPGFGFGFANELRSYNGIFADAESPNCKRDRAALEMVGSR